MIAPHSPTPSGPTEPREPVFPIRVSGDGRHFVDREGWPVFWLGTTQWQLFREFTMDGARTIIEGARRRGFAFVQAMLLGVGDGTRPDVRGDVPWLHGDPLRPNEGYFRHVDAVLDAARERGIVISMTLYHRRHGERITLENARAWAGWVARRYGAFPNVVWSLSPQAKGEYVPLLRELATGIREGDRGEHLITVLPDPAPFSSAFVHGEDWLDFGSVQTWSRVHLIHPMVTGDRGLEPPKPIVVAEGAYERGSEYGFEVTPLWVRRQAYYSYLAGGHHAYGHNDSWRVLPGWEVALDAPGAVQLGVLKRTFLERREWWRLVPDQAAFERGGNTEGRILNLAARHPDGAWLIVYLAERATVSVDMARMAAGSRVDASWVDPRSGGRMSAGSFAPGGARTFGSPEGWEDALLVLEAGADRNRGE